MENFALRARSLVDLSTTLFTLTTHMLFRAATSPCKSFMRVVLNIYHHAKDTVS